MLLPMRFSAGSDPLAASHSPAAKADPPEKKRIVQKSASFAVLCHARQYTDLQCSGMTQQFTACFDGFVTKVPPKCGGWLAYTKDCSLAAKRVGPLSHCGRGPGILRKGSLLNQGSANIGFFALGDCREGIPARLDYNGSWMG
mmetsp:Transcript_139668/g.243080  ORF Transcript_139668/g.243080 Transcript_139668/m.243080 type:complete len:143 (+) Transcript_139668:958-1386(+)